MPSVEQKSINIKVIPRSNVSHIEEDLMGNLKVRVKAPPVNGQANQELIGLLAEYYNVSKGQIEIIKGRTSRNKVVRVNQNPA